MPLNPKQKEAVEHIEGPLLVLAGPGTGKTHLLSARVENILKMTDTNPENILCLTFSENGASNMRERLLSTIRDAARKVQIHTYHAFGSDLIMKYKNYAESFDRNLDSTISEVNKYKLVRDILSKLEPLDILKNAKVKDVVESISSVKSARLSGDDLIFIAEKNRELTEKMEPEVAKIFVNAKKGARFPVALDTVYFPLLGVFAKYISTENIKGEVEPVSNILARQLQGIIDSEKEKEKPTTAELRKWRDRTFELDAEGRFRFKDKISNKKLASLGNVLNEYSRRMEEEGLFDFDDMIEQAILALKKDEGFRRTCQERFQYILLDEFQDTNPSQAEIVRLLTDYEEPNVMAVGDDDQAIFAFQGADASNLLTFQNHYNADVIKLVENYRSKQEILDFSRKIADQITDSFSRSQGVPKNLIAFNGNGAKISRHEFLTSDQEYQFVTNEIEKLIRGGVSQKQIAIIAPKHKYILSMLPFLKESGVINISYEKRDNILEDPRISEIIRLSEFIYGLSLGKDVSSMLLEILSFPFWEIPAVDVVQSVYRQSNSGKSPLDYLVESKSEKIRAIGGFVAKLVTLSFDSSLELMLDSIVGTVPVGDYRSPYLEFYAKELGDYETFELYENLAVLKETLREHSKESILRLKDFVLMIQDYREAEMGIVNVSPYKDSENAIQIVTAHKSKGLEYEYVFLIAADNMSWGTGKGNNNGLVLPKNLEFIRHTGATEDEKLRLFFVAATRAKSVMYITNSLKDFAGKTPARLAFLQEYENGSGDVISPFLPPEGEYKVQQHFDDLNELRKVVDLRKTWRSVYAKQIPELRPILVKRMENYRLSATDLINFINIYYGGPMSFYEQRILLAPREPADERIMFGNILHRVYEKITKEKISDEEAITYFREEVQKNIFDQNILTDFLERGELALKVSLAKIGETLRNPCAKAEVNLKNEHIYINDVPVDGKIDLLVVNDEENTIEVFDYKTGRFEDSSWGSSLKLFMNYIQLYFYKFLLNNSPTYKKYKVSKGHILFVVPDGNGEVHEKELNFEKDRTMSEADLSKLVSAVYKYVSDLSFLDDEDLALDLDKNAGVKEVKDFIKVLLEKYDELG